MMRKKVFLSGVLALGLLLAACAPAQAPVESAAVTDWAPLQMAQAIWDTQEDGPEYTVLLPGDPMYDTLVSESYGLDPALVEDGAVLLAGGASAREAAVLRLSEDADPQAAVQALEDYLEARAGEFAGYLPEEAALLEEARVVTRGSYVALLACGDPEAAEEAFGLCFTQPPPKETSSPPAGAETQEVLPPQESAASAETPLPEESTPAETAAPSSTPQPAQSSIPQASPTVSWQYDEARLLEAWAAGDWSMLAEEDQAILDICREVIDTVVPADGSECDKELAVHDWMIAHGSYDSNTLSMLPDFQENPQNDNPYGFLVDGLGICMGYTTTFQLFMDLLGIQCITVEGTAYHGTEDHAWNQVQLDGAWYCVDVTWDDPTTTGAVTDWMAHRFFNVTSDYMRTTDHQWDESAVPEAEGTALAWQS